ncbi:MAG: hypothetical protein NTY02_08850 [Acidobacteria bacterium]|nr:hypothetical protein [Acidobacteriota bacterium]
MKSRQVLLTVAFVGLLHVLPPFPATAAAQSPSESGVWMLVETRAVDKVTPVEPEGEWYVLRQTSGLTHLSEQAGDRHRVTRCVWTIPPSQMKPGDTISITLTAENILMQHAQPGTLSCSASLDNSDRDTLDSGPDEVSRASVSREAGSGASATETKKFKVPARVYGGTNGRMRMLVKHDDGNEPLGYVYVYQWKPGAGA